VVHPKLRAWLGAEQTINLPRCEPSAAEPEGDPSHDGRQRRDDEPPLPGLRTDPGSRSLGSEPRPLGL